MQCGERGHRESAIQPLDKQGHLIMLSVEKGTVYHLEWLNKSHICICSLFFPDLFLQLLLSYISLTSKVHVLMNKAALTEHLSVFSTDELHCCFYCTAVLENVPFVIFTWAEPESPDGSRTFCWRVSFISLGLQSSFSSLRSSWIMSAVKYTNGFELNKINTFFVRTVADKKHKSKLSSQRWFKVKTHTHMHPRACTCITRVE